MAANSAVEIADRKSRQRAILFAFATLVFLGVQVLVHPMFGNPEYATGWRMYSWTFTIALLLMCLGGGGGWANPKPVRDLINDEVARNNYRTACKQGFWAAMVLGLAIYVVPEARAWTGGQVAYVLVSVPASVAMLAFSWLELRSHADA